MRHDFSLGLWIGFRYLYSRSRSRVSTAFIISMLGVALGVTTLITVMSVMNGFHRELETRILGVIPHLLLVNKDLAILEPDDFAILNEDVVAASRFLSVEGLIQGRAGRSQPLQIYAIDVNKEAEISIIPERIVAGSLEALQDDIQGIVLGAGIVQQLGINLNDEVLLVFADQPSNAQAPRPLLLRFILVGVFAVDAAPDYGIGLIEINRAIELFPQSSSISGWRFRLQDVLTPTPRIESFRKEVEAKTNISAKTLLWTKTHGGLFRTVKMEKILMFLILFFIITIASFNLVSAQAMIVDYKQKNIGILRTLGMNKRGIVLIFIIQGLFIGISGVLLGNILGVLLSSYVSDLAQLVDQWIGFSLVAGTYFVRLPVDIQLFDVVLINFVSILLTLVSTLYPGGRAGNINPVAALNRG